MGFLAELNRNLWTIYAAAFLRSVGVGLTGVVLGLYLSRSGFSATFIGTTIAAGLAGAALGMLVVGAKADGLGRRRTLSALALLAGLGGLGLGFAARRSVLLLVALLGMVNGFGTDRGPSFALEQAVIPQLTSTERRTWSLAWHSLILDLGHAVGALGAVLPLLFQTWLKVDLLVAYKVTFGVYAGLNLLTGLLYVALSPQVEVGRVEGAPSDRGAVSPESKRIVAQLSALSGLDSLGGGFLSDALVAYWFFRRFGVAEGSLGPVFFVSHLLNSVSYPVAAWLAHRIGLVNTMVFTHIPSNLFLMAVPVAPSFAWAVVLLLARESLVEMDVPTRQSYILGVVQPSERTYASAVTNLTRNIARSVSPSLAGLLMQHLALGSPLFLGGAIKIVYDLALYRAFHAVKPPEEQARAVGSRLSS